MPHWSKLHTGKNLREKRVTRRLEELLNLENPQSLDPLSQMGTLEFKGCNAETERRKKAEPVSPALKRARLSKNRLQ